MSVFKKLAKGSLQRRNKVPTKPSEKSKDSASFWQEDVDGREQIPKAEGELRKRMLHKLHSKTEVRRHGETGERLFLMHRHMGKEEQKFHKNNMSNYTSGTKTSWSAAPHISNHLEVDDYDDDHNNITSKTVSAWIPESDIHASLNQLNHESNYADEHEHIVEHKQTHFHASKNVLAQLAPTGPNDETSQRYNKLNINRKVNTPTMGKMRKEPAVEVPKKLAASEVLAVSVFKRLAKGSLQRRNKFNPDKSSDEIQQIGAWVSDADSEDRDKIPKINKEGKVRMLQKLHSKTEVRKHPETGERLFLMHRGMDHAEYKANHRRGQSQYVDGTKTSWTTDPSIAKGHSNGEFVSSAWIPESAIHSGVNQVMNSGTTIPTKWKPKKGDAGYHEFSAENEYIIHHNGPHAMASEEALKPKEKNINERINSRKMDRLKFGNQKNHNEQIKTTFPKKLAASEVLATSIFKLYKGEKKELKAHTIFSVENAKHPAKLKTTHSQMVRHLKDAGHDVESVKGEYDGKEKSIIVHSPSKNTKKEIENIASDHGQDSVLHSDGSNHKIKYVNGPNKGKHHKGSGTEHHDKEPEDYYTTRSDGSHFTHNIDMNKLHKGEDKLHLEHYSSKKDLKEIDAAHAGTGVDNRTSRRPETKMSYFYRKGTTPEDVVNTGGAKKYNVSIDKKKHKLYDLSEDKHKYIKKVKEENNGALDMDNVHKKIKESGHAGWHASKHKTLSHAVMLYDKHPVKKDDINKSEVLMKGFVKNTVMAGLIAASTPQAKAVTMDVDGNVMDKPAAVTDISRPKYSKDQILDAIAHVETSGGKNMNHATIKDPNNMNYGTHSRSKYGVMPVSSKSLISKDKNLKKQYGHLLNLKGDEFHKAYHADPSTDRKMASAYYDKSAKLFGHDPEKILFSWLNGRNGTLKAIKRGDDISNHWHVRKGMKILEKATVKGNRP